MFMSVSDLTITSNSLRHTSSETISDFPIPTSSIIELTVVPARLRFQIKQIRLTQKCKDHIYKTLTDPQFLQIGWNFYKFKEYIHLPKNVYESNKLKLDYTSQYRLEIDDEFVAELTESPALFDLCACGQDANITLSRAEMCVADILDAANKKQKYTVYFSNAAVDMTDYVAALKVSYKITCNAEEIKSLYEKVQSRKTEKPKETLVKPVDACSGDFFSPSEKTELSITVVKLFFMDGSRPMIQDTIQQVYIEYSFLGETGPEMEAPFSLRKGTYKNPTIFNWTKTFNLDIETNYEMCKTLTRLVQTNELVKFFVISEPTETWDTCVQICEYVGYAEVCLREIFWWEKDMDIYQYEILDSCNPLVVIGYLTVRFEGIAAMRRVLSCLMSPNDFQCL